MCLSELFLDLTVVVDLTFLRINQQDLSWLQATFRYHITGFKIHHANLTGNYHHTLFSDGIATGAQAVSVEHTTCVATIAEQQGCRTVPRLHQDGVILVEGLQILRDGVLVVEALRHQDSHRLRQGESAHHQELEHVVETGRVTHTLLHNRAQILDVTQCLTRKHTLTSLHPPTITSDGVDLTVMG